MKTTVQTITRVEVVQGKLWCLFDNRGEEGKLVTIEQQSHSVTFLASELPGVIEALHSLVPLTKK
jgi:hypothetical protein